MKLTQHVTVKSLICSITFLFASLFFVSCGGGSSSNSSSSSNDESNSNTIDNSQIEAFQEEVFTKINAARAAEGKTALILDDRIIELGLAHNIYMAAAGALSHDGFNPDRMNSLISFGYSVGAENVAYVTGIANDAVSDFFVDGWINSPGHLENILDDFTHTGISVYHDSASDTFYATQIFAK